MKWFVQAFETGGKFSLNLIAKSAAAILRGIGRITGGGFLEAMAEFIGELNDLFGGFKERAARVEKALRSEEVAFVLVTSASPPSIQEVLYFAERLAEADATRRVRRESYLPVVCGGRCDGTRGARCIAERGLVLEDDAPERRQRSR